MKPLLKNYGSVILAVIAAIAMIVSALVWKNTEYENVWLYILTVFLVLQAFWEVYVKRIK